MEALQVKELLLQSLEHEHGGVRLYEAALECAVNDDLRQEWQKYLAETRNHVTVLTRTIEALGLDPDEASPGRAIVAHLGAALVEAIRQARQGDPAAAQIVACECVVLAETKDHLDWELIGRAAARAPAGERQALQAAYDEIEDQEDEHLYHTKGWCRELWLQSLGLKAVLPPPEERKHVKTAIGAARAEQTRASAKH
jgi:rubrerythrin